MESLVALYTHWLAAEAARERIRFDAPNWMMPHSTMLQAHLPDLHYSPSANLPQLFYADTEFRKKLQGLEIWLALLYVVIDGYLKLEKKDLRIDSYLAKRSKVEALRKIRDAQFHSHENLFYVGLFLNMDADNETIAWAWQLSDNLKEYFDEQSASPKFLDEYSKRVLDGYSRLALGHRLDLPTSRYRTHTCGELRVFHIGIDARLSGWCHRIRDHGGVLFIDLRDHYGLTQVVVDPDSRAFGLAELLRSEWVVQVDGKVRVRPKGTENPELPTGAVEVYVHDIEVLGAASELPMPVFGDQEYPEEIRLKYRFLDLRRDKLHHNIMKRGQIIDSIRRRMKEQGFFEFQTPILTASSPEGARDYLVPSRIHPGKFYALPQAPQQFKQLIMISGFDRYFQIAPCFRDEDARADRSPGEFYQLDLEMSFVTQDEVFAAVEPVIRGVFEEFAEGKPVTAKFPQISYGAAIRAFGTDKPDLRNPLMIHDVTNVFRDSGFALFAKAIAGNPLIRVWAIPAPGGGSRAFCDRMNSWAQSEGQPGLGYAFFSADAGAVVGRGPIANNLGPERTIQLQRELNGHLGQLVRVPLPLEEQTHFDVLLADFLPVEVANLYRDVRPRGLVEGDSVFFVMGVPKNIYKFSGVARNKIGEELGLIRKDRFDFCWIVNFPMYEWNEEEKRIDFSHNPFSMPNMPIRAFLDIDLSDRDKILSVVANQYDIVCNGVELSSGAIRNHRPDVMKKAFAIAGYDESVLEKKFGGMLHALSLGAPPHGGIAPGIDRIVMLLCGEENLREVVLFPMNQRAEDLMMGAPSEVTAKQLRELHIRLVTQGMS
jgi:aspartyl-tRNA synthetase